MAAVARKNEPSRKPDLGLVPMAERDHRIEAVDFARGVAVTLMILSHGVKGLLTFAQIPAWGMVPVHLFTKFSSSLFILVFGISLAVIYGPHVGTTAWPRKRKKMWLRGLKVLFWYKALTIVEMTPMYSRDDILAALTYQAFPVYVEILGFYALALLWIPLVLPLWQKLRLSAQCAVPVLLAVAAYWLYHHFDFWGFSSLQAIMVEHPHHYTWGQLARGPLIFLGLLLGQAVLALRARGSDRLWPSLLFAGVGAVLLAAFFALSGSHLGQDLLAIARNEGKHPPEVKFMLFSLAGAFLILGASFLGGKPLAKWLSPVAVIGRDSLQAFICHIFVIFVFYRYLLNYRLNIFYEQALELTAVVIVVTAGWIKVLEWIKKSERPYS